jgi:hypothetical protein
VQLPHSLTNNIRVNFSLRALGKEGVNGGFGGDKRERMLI